MNDEIDMSTDGSTPQPCDPEIFSKGVQVFVTDTLGSNAIESWVRKVSDLSGQPVDWHWAGGRARVLALGDIDRVKAAITALKLEHDQLYAEACRKLGIEPEPMTMNRAIQDLRIMAASIVVDNGGYVKRLNAIADFLESII
jgi:hypothetical protein